MSHSDIHRFTAKICISIIIFVVFTAHSAPAEESRTLLVAIANWPPWKIIEQGEFSGIDVDILRAIGTRLELRFEFIECPWRRCLELVKIRTRSIT